MKPKVLPFPCLTSFSSPTAPQNSRTATCAIWRKSSVTNGPPPACPSR